MVLPRPILAVVFDMDGLLIDTETLYRDAIMGAARAMGAELPLPLFHRMIGVPIARNREQLAEHFGPDFDIDALLAGAGKRFQEEVDFETLVKVGVRELLDFLDEAGIPRAVATSSPHESVQAHLGPVGLLHRFQAVVARGDYATGKPAPDPFLRAAALLVVDPTDCLALEDSHNGVRAAHAAGMMTIMVPDLLQPTDEMHEKCVAVAQSLHHVRDIIERAMRAPL
ncbi:MAG: HAD family hydrolase [Caulobacterales bacterium]